MAWISKSTACGEKSQLCFLVFPLPGVHSFHKQASCFCEAGQILFQPIKAAKA